MAFGEVGLSGEIRAVSQAENRVREAKRLGFKSIVLPQKNYEQLLADKKFTDMTLYGVSNIMEALSSAMPR